MKISMNKLSLAALALLLLSVAAVVALKIQNTANVEKPSQAGAYETFKLDFEVNPNQQSTRGTYEIDYKENPFAMTVTLRDVRLQDQAAALAKLKASALVETAYPIVTLDDAALRLGITFKRAVTYQVAQLENPGALVIEVAEDKAYQSQTVYQVHTEAMAAGEGLAMAEEMLMTKFSHMRVLPSEDKELFYLELGQYQTEAEAQQAVKTAATLGLTVAYRKVN